MSELAKTNCSSDGEVDRTRKDTGVPWIGKIPERWELRRLRFLCKITTGDGDTQDAVEDGRYPFFVRSDTVERSDRHIFDGEGVLTSGDGAGVGEIYHYHNGKMAVHQRVYLLHSFDSVLGRFLYYYMKSNFMKRVQEGTAKSTVDSLRLPMLQDFPVVFPPKHEQQHIINFLDQKTATVDELIAKKKRLIALLEEKRAALINRAVTRGFDPGVPMKDSGVPALGLIASSWDTSKLKFLTTRIVDGVHHTPEYVERGIPFITVQNLTGEDNISFEDTKFISEETHREHCKRIKPRKGDVLLTKDGTLGVPRVVETDRDFNIFVSVAALRPIRDKIDPWFLRFALASAAVKDQFQARKLGSALLHLHLGEIANTYVSLPPMHVQQQIVEALRAALDNIDRVTSTVSTQLDRIQEFRQSLITAAVTGRVELKDAVENSGVATSQLQPSTV